MSPHEEPLHVTTADGLHLPDDYIGHDGGLVVRLPVGITIDFKLREWGAHVGIVQPRHFGETSEGRNDHLDAFEVSLKKYGEDPDVYAVDVDEEGSA